MVLSIDALAKIVSSWLNATDWIEPWCPCKIAISA